MLSVHKQLLDDLVKQYGRDGVIAAIAPKKKGRPKKLRSTMSGLVLSMDWMIDEYERRGHVRRQARAMAFRDMKAALEGEDSAGRALPDGKRRIIDMATIRRYYNQGVRELRDGEARLAQAVDELAEQHGLETALAGDFYGAGGVTSLRYERGKRALAEIRRKRG